MSRGIRIGLALLALALVAPWALTLPGELGVRAQVRPLKVVTSIAPLGDLVAQVGGERIEVTALVPLGDGPEDYDPTPADAQLVARADLFFVNGLGLESYLDDLVAATGNQRLEIVTLSDGLPRLGGFGQGAEEGGNPHLWLNPRLAAAYVETIRQTLSRLDPDGQAQYAENAARYSAQLAALDAEVEQLVQSLAPEARILVTTHDAFPYFAERYGLRYLAVVSVHHEAGPSAQEYAALVRAVRDNRVKAVFGEAGFSDQFAAQLADDTGARYVGDLYTDTLSEQPPTNTYLGAMRHNAETIVEALR